MPLEALISHIESLVDKTRESEKDIDTIPYAKIKSMLLQAVENFRNGLKIAKDSLALSLIKKATIIAETQKPRSGVPQSTEQVLYTNYREILSESYSTAERLNTEVTTLAKTEIAPELYHWLLEIPESFNIQKIIVLREGNRFLTETFEQLIVNPLRLLIATAKEPEVPGSLVQIESLDLLAANPIEEGYVVSCIRGESTNPVMWPILCHEMFELADKEKGIVKEFYSMVSKADKSMPVLDKVPETNELYILEILMDFLAINSFGPMYAKSLLEYCKRSPYYPTPQYPDMCVRLFCTYLYLSEQFKSETDIFAKCQKKALEGIRPEILQYEQNKELDEGKERKLGALFVLMMKFLGEKKTRSFIDRLKDYSQEAQDPKATLSKVMESNDRFIPFKDPLLTFEDITNNIFHHHVALAIDPNILLNVVLANYDLYQGERHRSILLDSFKKWKVKQAWNISAREVQSTKAS